MKPTIADEFQPAGTSLLSKLKDDGLAALIEFFAARESDEKIHHHRTPRSKTKRGRIIILCAHCDREQDERGHWHRIASRRKHYGARLTHGICPDCTREHFPEVELSDGEWA